MSQKNSVSAVISEVDKQSVLTSINDIKGRLSSLLLFNLSPSDRKEMLKMGDKTLAFVDKALGYADKHPELIPPYLDLDEAKRDFSLANNLNEILRELSTLYQSVEDVLMLSGSEAYSAALMFHASVKGASRSDVAGSRAIYDDLAQRFPGRPRKTVNPT
jgi:histidyl-tRNA synthetase